MYDVELPCSGFVHRGSQTKRKTRCCRICVARSWTSTNLPRCLMQGKLLQLELPAEVKPSLATAQRSNATGSLLLTMPKEHPDATYYDVACSRWSCSGMSVLGALPWLGAHAGLMHMMSFECAGGEASKCQDFAFQQGSWDFQLN